MDAGSDLGAAAKGLAIGLEVAGSAVLSFPSSPDHVLHHAQMLICELTVCHITSNI